MCARSETISLQSKLAYRGIQASFDQVNTLRRAQLTLHRWYEQECGDSGPFSSWAIERDEQTQKPYRVIYPHSERAPYRTKIADREAGAKRRVEALCKELGLVAYYQTDPRGCALYVSAEPIQDHNYTQGVACC